MQEKSQNSKDTPRSLEHQNQMEYLRKKGVGKIRLLASIGILLFTIVLWGWLISGKLEAREIISQSMVPTFNIGDRIIIDELDDASELKRGDIVITDPLEHDHLPMIKRVVGIPGDFIIRKNDKVFVNHEPTEKELRDAGITDVQLDIKSYLPNNMFFLLGDNPEESMDSRYFGPISGRHIIGKAVFKYYPISEAGWIKTEEIPTNEVERQKFEEKYKQVIEERIPETY